MSYIVTGGATGMIFIIPIIATISSVGGLGTLVWWSRLNEEDKRKLDKDFKDWAKKTYNKHLDKETAERFGGEHPDALDEFRKSRGMLE